MLLSMNYRDDSSWFKRVTVRSSEDSRNTGGGSCPINHADHFAQWADHSLLCSAGRRELKGGRYLIRCVKDADDFRRGLEDFSAQSRAHEKTGYFAIVTGPASKATTVREEIESLAGMVCGAGLVDTPEQALSGHDIRWPVRMRCPVTGIDTVYTFFPVAFTRNAANPDDPLHDPALSCPFTAINTTSDAFAFAMLVRDRSRRHFGCEAFEIEDAEACRALLDASVIIWQNMSVNTIKGFARRKVDARRAVSLSPDARYWTAPHRDPVFAELEKRQHAHEMPLIYARALADKWFAAMYDGDDLPIGIEGQSGGVPISDKPGGRSELQQ